jgi:hypothetical protein
MKIVSTPFKKEIDIQIGELEHLFSLPIPMISGLIDWLRKYMDLDIAKKVKKDV